MGEIACKNYQFHYCFSGCSDRPLILFLHGFMGDCTVFEAAIAHLSTDFYCMTVDLPGHGQTKTLTGEDGYTMPATASGLVQLLDRLEIHPCVLVGYSMGGRLALYLTLHFPDHFSKAVVESGSPGLKTEIERHQRLERDRKLAEALTPGNFAAFLARWYDNPLFSSLRQHPAFEATVKKRLQNNPIELAKSLRNLSTGRQPCLWEKLPENQVPLLLLAGELDAKFVAINREMNPLCPQSNLTIIRNCGHNIHVEQPLPFANAVREFL